MKSSLEINEQIDELKIQARGIYEAVKSAGRDMTEDEASTFDQITKVKIPALEKDRDNAVSIESEIRKLEVNEDRQKRLKELETSAGGPAGRGGLPVPVNGRIEQDGDRPKATAVSLRASRLKAFKDERTAYDCGMWFRAMIGKLYNRDDASAIAYCHRKGWQVTNTGVEGTDSLGGFVVPDPLSQVIIDVRERTGLTRQILRVLPMTSDTLAVPRRAGGLTVEYPGEALAITTSDKTWAQVNFVARKRAVAHQISQELVDDAIISIVDDAVSEMAHALALREDAEVINGDGSAGFGSVTGLLSSLGAAGVFSPDPPNDTWDELVLSDFTNTIGLLPDRYHQFDPVWVCSSAFYHTVMLKLEAAAGGNTIPTLQVGDARRRMFLGYPVLLTEQMPTSTGVSQVSALFGAFSQGAILADRIGVRFGRSDEFAFLSDMTTLRATARYDIQVFDGGDASDAGAYVGLSTGATA